jgi:hypothetical protein
MRAQYPNLAKVELVAHALGALREQLVFVGGCAVDLLPMDSGILGFANRWYPLAVQTAHEVSLPAGMTIRLISAPAFLATKFEAFSDRGRGDLLGSHDLEDIVNVLDGRPELVSEITLSATELQQYLAAQCRALLAMPDFMDALPGMVFPDESLAERVKLLALRFEQIGKLDKE